MNSASLRLEKPSSPEAVEKVWEAYNSIPDREKKKLLKVLHKREADMFKYLIKHGGFPRGASPEKIENRELTYGRLVDVFLKNHKDGSFGENALFRFLLQTKIGAAVHLLKDLQQCGSKSEAESKLEEKLVEGEDDAMIILSVRYFQAFVNLEGTWMQCGKTDGNDDESEEIDKHTHTDETCGEAVGDSDFDANGIPYELDPAKSSTHQLDDALCRVSELTAQAKFAMPWSDEAWDNAVNTAKEAVLEVRSEVERLAASAGRPIPEWESREQLDGLLDELSKMGDSQVKRDKLIKFLAVLETEVRALTPKHKLPIKREAQARMRDEAANEIAQASELNSLAWPEQGPLDARAWLDWVVQQDGEGLEALISELCEAEYPATASLVGDLESGFNFGDVPIASIEKRREFDKEESQGKSVELSPPVEKPKPAIARRSRPDSGKRSQHVKTSPNGPQKPDENPVPPPIIQGAKDPVHVELETQHEDFTPVANPKPTGSEITLEHPVAQDVVLAGNLPEAIPEHAAHVHDTSDESCDESEFSNEVFEPLCDLSTAASEATLAPEGEIEPAIEKVIWKLLEGGERTLAFQILRNAHESGLTGAFQLPPSVLEILALLPAYSSNSSEVPYRVRTILQSEDFSSVFKGGEAKLNKLRRVLLAASLMRPSLFDPSSNAGAVLEEIRLGRFPSLHKIAIALTEFGRKGVDINSTILSATRNSKGWKEAETEIVEFVQRFLDEAPSRKMNYAPATWIWRHWFQDRNGWMRKLFTLAASQDRSAMDSLAAALRDVDMTEEINRGWDASNGRGQLVGTALESLRRLAYEALDLIKRRLDHWNSGPQNDSDYRHKVLEDLATTVARSVGPAKHELEQMAADGQSFGQRFEIAVSLMIEELDSLNDALQGKNSSVECPSLREWLIGDLMRLDQSGLDDLMDVSTDYVTSSEVKGELGQENDRGRKRLIQELQALRNPILGWPQAFEGALARCDHQAAKWILDRMARNQESGMGELEDRKTANLEETRVRVRRDLKSVESELGSAYSKGWLTPERHVRLLDLIHRRQNTLSDKNESKDLPYQLWDRDVALVKEAVRTAHQEQVKAAEANLKMIAHCSKEDIGRVTNVLSKGNVQLANEYIQQLIAGESIKHTEDTGQTQFFLNLYGDSSRSGRYTALHELLSSASFNPLTAISDIQNNETWCGIDLKDLEQTTRSTSASALQKWFQAQKIKKIDEKGIEVILRAFDFPISHISHDRGHYVAQLAGEIPCPIPDFGTAVRSKISIIVEPQRTSVDDVAQYLDRLKIGTNPVILLWLRPLALRARRSFARLCRQKSLKVLTIDSVLAAYLLTVEAQRLRALFECALPFTNVSPYTTTGGMLPEEMFFGRRREIEAIESAGQAGTCFVFGGRQIGKTVLLRKVEKDFPKHGKQNVALYLDLNFHAVGQTVAMDEIWKIIADELSKKDPTIFGKTARAQFAVEHFSNHVTEWLRGNDDRRILLLLDEADRFLQADGDSGDQNIGMPFQVCLKLKGLMDSTERRFKVVFAGLHNVQRSTRVANNPLAQLGIPVCVGPLYQNGESREAGRLISVPLAASGVFFDSIDTINSILARTNYYPNLIQIFCARLLRTTVDRQSNSNPDQTPPYRVDSDDVERVFNNHEIRDELRKKFMLTLDLDRRFSLIAHHMAFTANDRPDGFTVDDIQRDAVAWWPAGFEADRQRTTDSLREDLGVLLTEMCGLGILRRDSNDHYFLRSPNVVSLLGSPNDIEKVLEAASEWELPPPYSPDSFRSPTESSGDCGPWRSPLTARQETLIKDPQNPIIVISGCQAAGISEVPHRLESRSVLGEEFMIRLADETSRQQFEASFNRLSKREETGKTMILVPAACDWNHSWIAYAKQRLGQFTAKNKAVGVVFLADSAKIWKLLPEWKAIIKESGLLTMKLQRWDNAAVRQWLADTGLLFDNLRWIHKTTGGWHEAIRLLGDYVREGNSIDALVYSREETARFFKKNLRIEEAFGLPQEIAIRAIEILAQLGEPVTEDVLHEFYGSQLGANESRKLAPTLEWAEAVDVVLNTPTGWVIDPLVGELLTEAS